jgi:hypothetical protein
VIGIGYNLNVSGAMQTCFVETVGGGGTGLHVHIM